MNWRCIALWPTVVITTTGSNNPYIPSLQRVADGDVLPQGQQLLPPRSPAVPTFPTYTGWQRAFHCSSADSQHHHHHHRRQHQHQHLHPLPAQGGRRRCIAPVPTISTTIIITNGSSNTTFIPNLHRVADGVATTTTPPPPTTLTSLHDHHHQKLLHPLSAQARRWRCTCSSATTTITITTTSSINPSILYLHRVADGDVSLHGQHNSDPDRGKKRDVEKDRGDVQRGEE